MERRRDAPVSNVVKTWAWIIERKKKGKLRKQPILIQAFSGRYSKTNTQRKLAELIGTQLGKAGVAKYLPLSFDYKPKKNAKNCAGACQSHAKHLAKRIVTRLRKLL
jgi:hypothetical protein